MQLPQQRKESSIVPIYKADKTGCSNYWAHHCYQPHTKFYPTSFSQGYLHMQMKIIWDNPRALQCNI